MLFNSLYKLVLCLMRRLGSHNDRINAPIAGFVSALSIAVDSKSRRMLFSVLILSRALDTACNKAEHNVGKLPGKEIILWVVANTFLQATYAYDSDLMNKGLSKFFTTWSQQKPNDAILVKVWHRMYADRHLTGF
jgi:hypothetical protein